ncbi:MAG: chemotaxis protein CheB [Methanospirillum sp.]|uniref:chemotaxis protein CheB n=1 Tax=Methanospirillum sp. TaxID=45200 RepID=UPI00236CFFC8|nr:chemotaxis protein CheB [Methanospirillum sp.]MDD1727502.1 chemotaxis protein CheB [Methanospirillum sp.]
MKIAIIGSSTGGPFILEEIFTRFPVHSIAIIIVQHLPPAFISTFRGHIAALTTMKVSIGEAGHQISEREIIIAPAGKHMILEKNRIIRFDDGEKLHGVKPAVDRTMLSLRQIDGDRLLGIILTGMGQDGSAGIIHIRSLGGQTIVQDPSTAPIRSMPQAALDTGKVTDILTPKEISRHLQTF